MFHFLPSHLGIVCKHPLPSVCRRFRFPALVTAQPFWGLLGAGVPPLLGALPLVAYWGALKVFNYSLLTKTKVFRFTFSVLNSQLSTLNSKQKFSVFRFNPALQAFPPSHLGIVQTSLLSALGLASVSFLHYKRKTEHKVFRFPLSVFSFLCIFADVLCNRVQLCFGTKYGILLSVIYSVSC